ncbi:hypothetical protein [Burkholderia multivorans]|uniref:hypothetical protein n=1 Tax=Burkholderia multivorans TaxID=87883 RepID=UPI0020B25B4C|nr:hypothetical protein [Burkholderia multivorans]
MNLTGDQLTAFPSNGGFQPTDCSVLLVSGAGLGRVGAAHRVCGLGRLQGVCVLPADHRLAGQAVIRPKDLEANDSWRFDASRRFGI